MNILGRGVGQGYLFFPYLSPPLPHWQILQSAELNLQLTEAEVGALQEVIQPDHSGLIAYEEFASQAADIIASLNQNLPESQVCIRRF